MNRIAQGIGIAVMRIWEGIITLARSPAECSKGVCPIFSFRRSSRVPQRRHEVKRNDVWRLHRQHTLEVPGAYRVRQSVDAPPNVGLVNRWLCRHQYSFVASYHHGLGLPKSSWLVLSAYRSLPCSAAREPVLPL